jgi:hypothetical protein
MLMPKFVEVLPWVAKNKDALLALAAFLAPVTSIILGFVSYRAVVTGPRVQLRIAQEQNKLTERQLTLQEKQFQTTLHQLQFTVFGAVEQKWIDDFRDIVSQIFAISDRATVLHFTTMESPNAVEEAVELRKLRDEAATLISKIWLHLAHENEELTSKLRQWFFFPDEEFKHDVWVRRQVEIFDAAQKIMSERKEKISFIPTPSAGDHSSAPPPG